MMKTFVFQNPTQLIFGEGKIEKLPRFIESGKRILLVFGGGSVRNNGVYDAVRRALADYQTSEFWGIESNPTVETVRKAVAQAREEGSDFVLAVGGGSVIDASKLISGSILSEKDPWEITQSGVCKGPFIPLGVVLTIPATGSEMNSGSVISNQATKEKFAFHGQFPQFAIVDPTIPFSLPPYQVACGLSDTFVHTMEQYLTFPGQSRLMDRWAEGILQTLIEISPELVRDHKNLQLMSEFMICATTALNGYISWGVAQDWSTHYIGHEVTALTGLTHGHTLAIILPSTMRIMQAMGKEDKLLQYASRIWGIDAQSVGKQEAIDKAIACTVDYFSSLGLKKKLNECNIPYTVVEEIVERFRLRGTIMGEQGNMDWSVVEKILKDAYQ